MDMRLGFSQDLRQEQKTILSQRMIQSMELLQLPLQQLEERIEQELETNPVLELSENAEESDMNAMDPEDGDKQQSNMEKEEAIIIRDSGDNREDFQVADDFASLYDDTINEMPTRSQNWLEEEASRHSDMVNNLPSREETLQSHLMEQLQWYDPPAQERDFCERVINNLDHYGYLPYSAEELVQDKKDPKELELMRKAIEKVQSFEPRGIAAQDLKECLLLQIRPGSPYEKEMRQLISNHLEDIEKNRFPQISRVTGYSFARIQEVLEEIRQLNPRPGAQFGGEVVRPIVPDVYVDRLDDGSWFVRVGEGLGPELCINPYYRDILKKKSTDSETRDYIRKNMNSANWLIDAVNQRRLTLTRVSQEIVDHQRDFLEHGPHAIRPLKLQQIADRLGIHITTVSRACDSKWMQTPQGVYPLKKFFSGAIAATGEGNDTVAQDAVRIKLQKFIDEEDKTNPLSDEELVEMMKKEGVKISRRTIAKYRLAMDIPGSRQRRDWSNSSDSQSGN